MRELEIRENKMLYWGKSMYGGWFSTMRVNGEIIGMHRHTLKELREVVKRQYGFTLEKSKRFDN